MTKRYRSYDDYPTDDDRQPRRQQTRRVSDSEMAGASERRSSRYGERSSADYSRSRYGSRNASGDGSAQQRANGAEMQRSRSAAQQQSRQQQLQRQRQQAQQSQQQRGAGSRRQVELDQSGRIPRYQPPQDPRTRQQVAAQRNQAVVPPTSAASRYARTNSNYQARPTNLDQAADRASAFTSPLSFVVRIVIIIALVAVFGVRFAMTSGTTAKISDTQAQITAAQENLDTLNSSNEQLQASIDSRQGTIDAYNKLVQQSS